MESRYTSGSKAQTPKFVLLGNLYESKHVSFVRVLLLTILQLYQTSYVKLTFSISISEMSLFHTFCY